MTTAFEAGLPEQQAVVAPEKSVRPTEIVIQTRTTQVSLPDIGYVHLNFDKTCETCTFRITEDADGLVELRKPETVGPGSTFLNYFDNGCLVPDLKDQFAAFMLRYKKN